MPNDKQSLGLGFVRHFDLDVTIRAMLAYGEFIRQCMDDARTEECARCAGIAIGYAADDELPGMVQRCARNIRDAILAGSPNSEEPERKPETVTDDPKSNRRWDDAHLR